MLILCKDENPRELAGYMEGDYGKAIYLYLDLLHYGCKAPGIHVYRAEEQGRQTGLFLVYHGCLHCYSRNMDCAESDLRELMEREQPHTVFFCDELFDALGCRFTDGYELHRVNMFCAKPFHGCEPAVLEPAKIEELEEITTFLRQNKDYAALYSHEELYSQLRGRMEDGFGRCFIIRENGRIIFHAATMAEQFPVAVGGMALLDESMQGRGLGKRYLGAFYNQLIEDGYTNYCNNLDKRAENLHRALGYSEECRLVKLTKNH